MVFQQVSLVFAAESKISTQSDADFVETDKKELPKLEVIAQRNQFNQSINSSLSEIAAATVQLESPSHPNQIFDRVPGVWITRGSGQEHLSAIRSPVFTGAGACGGFMVLEDQVPTRPSGFCNINQLFEVNISQASTIDVLRGPGTVIYGANALHGAININTPGPAPNPFAEYSFSIGKNDYYRSQIALSSDKMALQASYTDAGSFRNDEDYLHSQFNYQIVHAVGNASGRTSLAYVDLAQDTAGFILGKDSYKQTQLRLQNLNPDAYRKGNALRLSSRWDWLTDDDYSVELIPYARSSQMEFLQHFLPGTPLEKNGQESMGLLMSWSNNSALSAGFELEWAQGWLTEYQENTIEDGSLFLRETRPQGFHYNYEVEASTVAAWFQWQHQFNAQLGLNAGFRAEYIHYDYDNKMLNGNSRDDGSLCQFGGCLYTRPDDRSDEFSALSPELGMSYQLNPRNYLYARVSRGYRAPQATELYRLQKGQLVADLNAETLNSIEFGLHGYTDALDYELVIYAMRKNNFIFRDGNGFNISDGKTKHKGIEGQLGWQLADELSISSNFSWAQHDYAFNRDLGAAGTLQAGNEIDSAPPLLAALQFKWQGNSRGAEAEWVYQGNYYLDAANEHSYSGHRLLNLKGWLAFSKDRYSLSLQINNLLNKRYAERADFAFGNYRYFPGNSRWFSLQLKYRY